MLLCGSFYSSNKPLMNIYLRPIVDDLLLLLEKVSSCTLSLSVR